MTALLDTSELVAALVKSHSAHERAVVWLQRAQRGEIHAVVAAHTLAELYAVLTRLPLKPPIGADLAWQLIRDDVVPHVEVRSLSADDYLAVLAQLSALKIIGGTVYDALLAHVAFLADVDDLVTLNSSHFRKVYPALSDRIREP